MYRIFRRTGYAYTEYSNVRLLVKQRLSREKKRYFNQQLSCAKNSKALWNDLRRLGLVKCKETQTVIKIDLDHLNVFFIESSRSAVETDVGTADITALNDKSEYFSFRELDWETVRKAIMRLTSNAVGPDSFSIKAYKCVLPFLLPRFTDLFNKSLLEGVFSSEWRQSYTRPIPKIANPKNCEDYRPISLLSNLSKALERCAFEQIVKYININSYVDQYQFAFREGLNTQTAVIKLCDDIRLGIDESKMTVAVFFNFSKAFDSVYHKRQLGNFSI